VSKSSRRSSRGGAGGAGSQTTPGAAASPAGGDPATTRRPATTTRAGRRERPRYGYADRSFAQRYRGLLLTLVGASVAVLVVGVVFINATAKAYTCNEIWQPEATAQPSAGESPRLGYVQPNMGQSHNVKRPQPYLYCPPASGSHLNAPGVGPIEPRVYRPDDGVEPMSWLHNLEHGALVVLYKCEGTDACDSSGQTRMREFYASFPNSPICNFPRGTVGPVIARFEDMAWPYAAIVWGRVLPLESFDGAQILQFFQTEGERTHPELVGGCQRPAGGPAPSGSAAPSAAPSDSGSAPPSAPAVSSPQAPAPASGSPGAASPSASPS
jgi:hypothetical protein